MNKSKSTVLWFKPDKTARPVVSRTDPLRRYSTIVENKDNQYNLGAGFLGRDLISMWAQDENGPIDTGSASYMIIVRCFGALQQKSLPPPLK